MAVTMDVRTSRCMPSCSTGSLRKANRTPAGLPALARGHTTRPAARLNRPASAVMQAHEESAPTHMSKGAVSPMAAAGAAALLMSQLEPALAVEDVVGSPVWLVLLEYVFVLGGYLVVAPALTIAYIKKRWFVRSSPETVFQFMLVFVFFPGIFLASPFLNFRPEDPGEQGEENIIM
mmetsp:Transcript_15723/g.30177  ORF Transcript_15723/g.30177 Transcript_15723/m.30177 type:complete len:177 (+) Transcript_15723:125-655(+)|eukprot:CAMPEP_0114256234 /NCGR_PEP_ID=MMETSP0058-20121206/18029_1 /TAXON_ID=36894 /ORGANISM="Pyramimonas parkeae, CCMP726" /LENGTH=176 /DNA_ID=CAMNT_0001370757 /DNA_START=82 /DNA_END=612 /DNA_ORIENTATION=+